MSIILKLKNTNTFILYTTRGDHSHGSHGSVAPSGVGFASILGTSASDSGALILTSVRCSIVQAWVVDFQEMSVCQFLHYA